jgi:hypothetical protein
LPVADSLFANAGFADLAVIAVCGTMGKPVTINSKQQRNFIEGVALTGLKG